jgi:hypothetical protein
MTSSNTDVVQIIEADAELRADEWVSRRIKLSSNAIWLETENTSSDVINVCSPSSDSRVPLDRSTRNARRGETVTEAYIIDDEIIGFTYLAMLRRMS